MLYVTEMNAYIQPEVSRKMTNGRSLSVKKTICIWIGAIGFCIVSFFAQRAYFLQKESDRYAIWETAVEDSAVIQEEALRDSSSARETAVEDNVSPQETTLKDQAFPQEIFDEDGVVRDIFADNGIVDLGNNCIAYQVPNNEAVESIFGNDEYFAGDRYIAICALDFNNNIYTDGDTYYLPDTYGNIAEMKMDESGVLYLRYETSTPWETAEVRIPFYFSKRMTEDYIDMDKWASYDPYKKQIRGAQEGLMSGEEDALPQTVWMEDIRMGEERYEAVFERVSPLYDFFLEHNWNVANYRLTVKNENRDIVSEHILLNHSAKYEEPHWLVDFTGDGYLDVAFCGGMSRDKTRVDYDELYVLVWNPETDSYEEGELPDGHIYWWNEELSSLIATADGDDAMYSYSDGEWKMVRRLQYDSSEGKMLELFYSEGGDVIEERLLEWDEVVDPANVWDRDNAENIRLYPEYPLWNSGIMDVGGIDVKKYYRRSEDNDE